MVPMRAAVKREAVYAEIPVIGGKIRDQPAAEQREIARRADLPIIWQAGRVAKRRARHAQAAGAQGHHLREAVFVPAQHFPQRGGGVVGAFGDQPKDCLLHRDAGAGCQAQLGGGHRGGVGGHRDQLMQPDAAVAQGLENHIQGHHFGQAGGVAGFVGIDRRKNRPGSGIDHNGGIARGADLRARRGGDRGYPRCGERQQGQTAPPKSCPEYPQETHIRVLRPAEKPNCMGAGPRMSSANTTKDQKLKGLTATLD